MTTATQKEINPLGLAPLYEIALVKNEPEVNSQIAKKTGLAATDVKLRMRYNCWTVDQFAQLCGKSVPTITNMTLQPILNGNKLSVALDHCYPFPGEKLGPKFIVRNEKSMNYLLSCI